MAAAFPTIQHVGQRSRRRKAGDGRWSLPARFEFPVGRDLWVPRVYEGWEARNRSSRFWHVAGKLKVGVDIAAGRAELDAIATQLAAEIPRNAGVGIAVVPLAEPSRGERRRRSCCSSVPLGLCCRLHA
jgi:hypothetical protein